MTTGWYDFVGVATATIGPGTLTLGAAEPGYRAVPAAAAGKTLHYVIEDGTDKETSYGIYNDTTKQLTRTLVASSTGSLLSLSGSAKVYLDLTSEIVSHLTTPHGARAKGNTSNQTISSLSTFTHVTCLTEEYDIGSFYNDSTKVFVPPAGRWLFVGQCSLSGVDDAKRMILRIGVDPAGGSSLSSSNAQSFDLFRGYSSVASGFVGGAGAAVVVADGTQSFGMLVWQDSDASVLVDASANLCNMSMVYIGEAA